MDVKVLGSGCANCSNTLAQIEQVAKAKGINITLSKVQDFQEIMTYKVMSLPAVVIDGKVVHAGGIPSHEKIEGWF
ncbi:MAG: thioredoxin family protein [Oxalobacter sp.]|jgi:small redox-active disulfide protein 2|nr:MAG: thioredoxin family protein [Oxalobacter sp.]